MSRGRQFAVVGLAAVWCGLIAGMGHALPGSAMWDAVQLHLAGRALRAGLDPFAVVRERLPYPLFYPLPAVVLFLPLSFLPLLPARVMWAMVQGVAWGIAGLKRPVLLIGLFSAGMLEAILLGQWSPILTAAALLPSLGFVWAAKPNIGLALFVSRPSRAALVGGVLLTLGSVALFPEWLPLWFDAVRGQIHRAPIARPGGFLLLLALIRWRTPEGRLLAALALVPQTTSMYETVPLLLIARARGEAYALVGLSLIGAFLNPWLAPWHQAEGQSLVEHLNSRWPLTLLLFYLPALLLVLRRKPELASPQPEPGVEARAASSGSTG